MNEQARMALPVLLPAIGLAAAAFLLAWKPWRGEGERPRGEWGAVIAFSAAYIAAIYMQAGQRGLQLKESWHWQWLITLSALGLGLIVASWKPRTTFKLIAAVLTAISVSLLFRPPASAGDPLLWKCIVGGLMLVNFILLEPLAVRRRGAALPLGIMIVFGCLSIVLLESHFANFSLMAAAMSACAGVAFAVALCNRNASMASGGMFVVATIFAMLLITGWVYGKPVSRLPLILVQAAMLAMWVGEWPLLQRIKPWQSLIARAAIVAVIGAAAIIVIIRANAQEEPIGDEYDYYSISPASHVIQASV